MNIGWRFSRLKNSVVASFVGVALSLVAASCGSAKTSVTATTKANAGTTTSTTSASNTSSTTEVSTTTTLPPIPSTVAAPSDFAPHNFSFVSTTTGFMFGSYKSGCSSSSSCSGLLRTSNTGQSWGLIHSHGIYDATPLLANTSASGTGTAVSKVSFISPLTGYAFDPGLAFTIDGGANFSPLLSSFTTDTTRFLDVEVAGSTTYFAAVGLNFNGVSPNSIVIGSFSNISLTNVSPSIKIISTNSVNPQALSSEVATIRAYPFGVAVEFGSGSFSTALVAPAGSSNFSAITANPCSQVQYSLPNFPPLAIAGTSPITLYALCASNPGAGSSEKTIFSSTNMGATWSQSGSAPNGGQPVGIDAFAPSSVVVSATSGATFLYTSSDGGKTFKTAFSGFPGGSEYLYGPYFLSSSLAAVLSYSSGSPFSFLVSTNGGASFSPA